MVIAVRGEGPTLAEVEGMRDVDAGCRCFAASTGEHGQQRPGFILHSRIESLHVGSSCPSHWITVAGSAENARQVTKVIMLTVEVLTGFFELPEFSLASAERGGTVEMSR